VKGDYSDPSVGVWLILQHVITYKALH
jgi:hypothetical protein